MKELRLKINHFLGGVLLVMGTTIGAGIIALPVKTAAVGFFPSLLILGLCWLLMLATAYFFLDVNFSVKGEPNLISMAHQTLGRWGEVVGWIGYLLFLYSLIAAYIDVSTGLFSTATEWVSGYPLPLALGALILPIIFGGFIYFGTEGVDLINRIMMVGLGVTYLFLIFFLPEKLDQALLMRANFRQTGAVIPIVIVAFGYHVIIPSLTTYMHHNKKTLRLTLFVGSIIPLILYIVWQLLTIGVIPFEGENGLSMLLKEGKPVTAALPALLNNRWVSTAASFFAFFVVITSFLGVILSLFDFLIDGLKLKRNAKGKLIALALTFTPPLIFVFSYQRGFFLALDYAGVLVAILLIFLPARMAWQLKTPTFYRTIWGRILLLTVMSAAFVIIALTLLSHGLF